MGRGLKGSLVDCTGPSVGEKLFFASEVSGTFFKLFGISKCKYKER